MVVKRQALAGVLIVFGAVVTMAGSAAAQTAGAAAASSTGVLRVRLTCRGCDLEFLKTTIGFADFVEDATAPADVDIVASGAELTNQPWRLTFEGLGRFAGRDRVLFLSTHSMGTATEIRRELARVLRLGLVEYATETAAGPQLDVTFRRGSPAPSLVVVNIEGSELDVSVRQFPGVPDSVPTNDRWNHWIFYLNLEADGDGERSSLTRDYHVSTSANRTTAGWKFRIGASRSLSRSAFTVSDGRTVSTRLSDWGAESLMVKSLGSHFALAVTSSVGGSTFSNEQLVARVSSGIEYDIFPYGESTRRSLTIQYTAGEAYYEYGSETIFGKLTEKVAQQALNVSLGLKQPWGQLGSTFAFRQQLTDLDRTRMTFVANLSVRLTRHLALISSGNYSRIRDQFTLEKGEITDEELLLRQRQLATGHRYGVSAGLSFTFGALSNAIVNPRFSR